MKKLVLLRIAILITVFFAATAILLFLDSEPQKAVKSPTKIHDEADYAAHIDLVLRHKILNVEKATHLSGVLIKHENRYFVLTAAHFVPQDQNIEIKKITVTLKGQPGAYPAAIYKFDRDIDCAIIKMDKIGDADFSYFGRLPRFTSANNLRVGERVCTIGSPLGIRFNLGVGEVMYHGLGKGMIPGLTWNNVIVHNAPIAGGSSGGPLLNQYGEITGLNVGSHSVNQFYIAIKIDDVLNWLQTLDPITSS